jgi:hypothetical protein
MMATLKEMQDALATSTSNLPTREQLADKLWSESCQELRQLTPQLNAMLARHQHAIDEGAKYGRECRLKMDSVLERAFQEWQVRQQVEKERRQ